MDILNKYLKILTRHFAALEAFVYYKYYDILPECRRIYKVA